MKMNDYNATVAQDVLSAITAFEGGTVTIGDVQVVLQSAIPRFENDGSEVATAVRLAEADLEEIQFTTPRDEQVPTAIFRLEELRHALEGATDA